MVREYFPYCQCPVSVAIYDASHYICCMDNDMKTAQLTDTKSHFLRKVSAASARRIRYKQLITKGMHIHHTDSGAPLTCNLATRETHPVAKIKPHAVYNLRQHFESLRYAFHYEVLAKKIDLSLFIEEDMPVAYWDMDCLHTHVINSLVSNAILHTPVGGKIAMYVGKTDNYTMSIKISDSGPGIPSAERGSVCFKQSDKEHDGAALDKALFYVQAHKGKICTVDEPGFSGTTFKIELPLYTLCIQ